MQRPCYAKLVESICAWKRIANACQACWPRLFPGNRFFTARLVRKSNFLTAFLFWSLRPQKNQRMSPTQICANPIKMLSATSAFEMLHNACQACWQRILPWNRFFQPGCLVRTYSKRFFFLSLRPQKNQRCLLPKSAQIRLKWSLRHLRLNCTDTV